MSIQFNSIVQHSLIKNQRKVLIPSPSLIESTTSSRQTAITLASDILQLGYVLSHDVIKKLCLCNAKDLAIFHTTLVDTLSTIIGNGVDYIPMYPNFPQQVMEMSAMESWLNAMIHYASQGTWIPVTFINERSDYHEDMNCIMLNFADVADVRTVADNIFNSSDSTTSDSVLFIKWILDNHNSIEYTVPKDIPYNETKCIIASHLLQCDQAYSHYIDTATDILRIVTCLSEGDVSLSELTHFKSLPRKLRRSLTLELERVINIEDINRHSGQWIKVFHCLHVGDYSQTVFDIASKFRNNEKIKTFNSSIERFIRDDQIISIVKLLKTRPGEYARRLDQLIRLTNGRHAFREIVLIGFVSIINHIPNRILCQLIGHFTSRSIDRTKMIVFPKGMVQKIQTIDCEHPAIEQHHIDFIVNNIKVELLERFSQLPPLGNVFISEDMKQCPIPSQMRSASTGKLQTARGTHIPCNTGNTLRLFLYWKGHVDVDLSATVHTSNLDICTSAWYGEQTDPDYGIYHSGDITDAPFGAAEFIDIDINKSLAKGARYVLLHIQLFSNGLLFSDLESVYTGWQIIDEPMSNQLFEPSQVQQKLDIQSQCRTVLPVVFDLKTRKIINIDLTLKDTGGFSGNNILSTTSVSENVLKSTIQSDNRMTIYDLLSLHAKARGRLCDSDEEADFTVGFNDDNLTPYDITTILGDYI